MGSYLSRLTLVGAIFLFCLGVGVLVTQEGGNVPLLPDQVASAAGVYDFTWAPDGKTIAFVSTRSGYSEIWTVAATGGIPLQITSTTTIKRQPRWSKDGKWIAYVAVRSGRVGDIELVSPDGQTSLSLVETPADEREPAWSPDSRQIAFTERSGGRTQIALINLETRQIRRLAESAAYNLQWSADGKAIAFVADPLLPNDDRRDNEDLFVISADTGSTRLLTPATPRFREGAPSWSPDSRFIAFTSDNTGFNNVYILDMQTGNRRALNSGSIEHLSPKWSPDGKSIAYITNKDSQFNIWVVPVQGGIAVRVSDRDGVSGGFESDDAGPRGTFHWSPDSERIAFTHSEPAKTPDLWIGDLTGSRSVQLTNSMPAELRREARFVTPDLITYRSFDGTEIGGLVYKPRGVRPRAGHPALLMFRDSIDGQNALGWDPFIQFFVSDGYVVFAPNVRGSTGRGKDFRQLAFQRGGDDDVRDAFMGLDRLSSEGLIDTARLGVFGAGTGGFLVSAALIKDESRFKAAVNLYGIVDAVTATAYPGMGTWARYLIGATPMSNPIPYYERSLVNFVDKLRTPIIFLYTSDDASAPFQQIQQFAVQAEVKGKWFEYRVFDGESDRWQHWRPNSMRQALEAMDALFEKHLLGRDREIRLSRSR